MFDEDYIMVERWDEILGRWTEVDEARSTEDAENMITEFRDDVRNHGTVYSILQVKRVVKK